MIRLPCPTIISLPRTNRLVYHQFSIFSTIHISKSLYRATSPLIISAFSFSDIDRWPKRKSQKWDEKKSTFHLNWLWARKKRPARIEKVKRKVISSKFLERNISLVLWPRKLKLFSNENKNALETNESWRNLDYSKKSFILGSFRLSFIAVFG